MLVLAYLDGFVIFGSLSPSPSPLSSMRSSKDLSHLLPPLDAREAPGSRFVLPLWFEGVIQKFKKSSRGGLILWRGVGCESYGGRAASVSRIGFEAITSLPVATS